MTQAWGADRTPHNDSGGQLLLAVLVDDRFDLALETLHDVSMRRRVLGRANSVADGVESLSSVDTAEEHVVMPL